MISGSRCVRLPRCLPISRELATTTRNPGTSNTRTPVVSSIPWRASTLIAVTVRAVTTVVVAGDDHDGHRHLGQDASERLVVLVVVLVGQIALHDDELRAPRESLAQRRPRAHDGIGLGRVTPLSTGADAGPSPEPSLAEVQVADRRDASQLPPRRRRQRAHRLRTSAGDRHLHLGAGTEPLDDRAARSPALDGESRCAADLERVRARWQVPPADLHHVDVDREDLEPACGPGASHRQRSVAASCSDSRARNAALIC